MPNETKGYIGKDWRFIKKLEDYLKGNEMSGKHYHLTVGGILLKFTGFSSRMLRHDPKTLLYLISALSSPV